MNLRTSTRRFGAVVATATLGAGLLVAAAGPAGAITDPDRGICSDGTGSIPPGAWLRDANNVGTPILYLTKTGYNGSQDHFYIEGDFTRGTGAHWYTGYGYDHDNNIKLYGAVLDSWIAKASGGGCSQ
ncbi:MAG: hypothetical protein ABI140_21110 [Jatrophihabitantaceae bacterium]